MATVLTPVAPSDAQLYLVVSEIMYHPDGDGLAEFIELTNISTTVTLDLTGVRFVTGIDFDFTGSAVTSLAPGARVLVVRDLAAFTTAHGGGHPVAGVFANSTRLSNDGETIKLEDASNSTIKEFTYNDAPPWPTAADAGYSLVLIDPTSNPDPDITANWRSSTLPGGNPNGTDLVPFPTNPLGDDDGNGTADLVDYAIGSDLGLPVLAPTASFETYDIGGSMQTLLTLSYPISLGAESASIGIDASTDLSTWTDAAANTEFISQINLGDGRAMVTVRFTAPIGDGVRHFLRLRVEQL
ncbi:MAG: lamin tail domain-containing protein [Verrucomicrobia bacterium]|nr:lamin tail domain-containing protein [Verrucomicrobiota bacterium]MDA1005204.1 lamin tail domain-containing protein [Verrucomicrobiota bacterium]